MNLQSNKSFNTPVYLKIRQEICATCDRNHDNVCLECGCQLDKKIGSYKETCPLDRWPSSYASEYW